MCATLCSRGRPVHLLLQDKRDTHLDSGSGASAPLHPFCLFCIHYIPIDCPRASIVGLHGARQTGEVFHGSRAQSRIHSSTVLTIADSETVSNIANGVRRNE